MVLANVLVIGMLATAIALVAGIFLLEVEWDESSISFFSSYGKKGKGVSSPPKCLPLFVRHHCHLLIVYRLRLCRQLIQCHYPYAEREAYTYLPSHFYILSNALKVYNSARYVVQV